MPAGTLAIDCQNTFESAFLMKCAPKVKFGSESEPETNAAGVPKWTLDVAVTYLPSPGTGRTSSEVIAVTITSPRNPADGVSVPCAITFDRLRLGVSNAELRGDRVRGGNAWYNAEGIHAASSANHRPAQVKADA